MLSERLLTAVLRLTTKKYFAEFAPYENFYLPAPQTDKPYMLYVHIPFCESLCPYCSFNRFLLNEKVARSYFAALRTELNMIANLGYQFPSMYIGGGTPTVLIDELVETIDLCRSLFGIREVSCETNPNHLNEKVIPQLKDRVQRLSVGVQSFDNTLLKKINRFDKFGSGETILAQIQSISNVFHTLNLDMIFNFPGQTQEMVIKDTDKVIASGANQVTFYPLMTAPAVETSMRASMGKINHRKEALLYWSICQHLAPAFQPASAWTFSRRKHHMIDEYIVEYENYVGAGSGAFSYLNGNLYINTFSLKEYQQKIASGKMPVAGKKAFSPYEQIQYRFMMELFGLHIDKKSYQRDFNISLEKALWKELTFMRLFGGFSSQNKEQIIPSAAGRYFSVVMMREFFSGINQIRDRARQALLPEEQSLTCLRPI
ncbi:MAG: coproporphyrinogen III oxidase family protein [Anaerolineae bacterium]|nr:coproporphyrinogen III oxidase family protein [Anaerolineae bacterium]